MTKSTDNNSASLPYHLPKEIKQVGEKYYLRLNFLHHGSDRRLRQGLAIPALRNLYLRGVAMTAHPGQYDRHLALPQPETLEAAQAAINRSGDHTKKEATPDEKPREASS